MPTSSPSQETASATATNRNVRAAGLDMELS
jgi:hypothetical protein